MAGGDESTFDRTTGDLPFSPTPLSRSNLIREGIDDRNVIVTGNTVIDALYWVVDKIKSDKALDCELVGILAKAGYDVSRLNGGKKLVLITGHHRENFGDGFIHMCTAIKDLTKNTRRWTSFIRCT